MLGSLQLDYLSLVYCHHAGVACLHGLKQGMQLLPVTLSLTGCHSVLSICCHLLAIVH